MTSGLRSSPAERTQSANDGEMETPKHSFLRVGGRGGRRSFLTQEWRRVTARMALEDIWVMGESFRSGMASTHFFFFFLSFLFCFVFFSFFFFVLIFSCVFLSSFLFFCIFLPYFLLSASFTVRRLLIRPAPQTQNR